jgi:hypothetical protein
LRGATEAALDIDEGLVGIVAGALGARTVSERVGFRVGLLSGAFAAEGLAETSGVSGVVLAVVLVVVLVKGDELAKAVTLRGVASLGAGAAVVLLLRRELLFEAESLASEFIGIQAGIFCGSLLLFGRESGASGFSLRLSVVAEKEFATVSW